MAGEVTGLRHRIYVAWLWTMVMLYALHEETWRWWRGRHDRADEREMGPRISLEIDQEIRVNGRPCFVMRSKQNSRLFMVVDLNGQGFWATSRTIEQ